MHGGRRAAVVAAQCCNRVRGVALGDHIAGATFTLAALGGHAEFKLNLVKTHPGTRVAGDFSIGDPVAYANNHGGRR